MSILKPKISTANKLTKNIKPWGRNYPRYVVFHFTGGFGENSDTTTGMMDSYIHMESNGSNAHYLVGRDSIWEMVNPKTYYCTYSCGASVGRQSECLIPGWGPLTYMGSLSMSHSKLAGHTNTINVEVCSCKVGTSICKPMDSGWYFTDGTYTNAVKLIAWLCQEYGIKIDNIIMHNQITGKICPAMWCNREGAEAGFSKFKEDVSSMLNGLNTSDTFKSPSPKPEGGRITIPMDSLFYSRPSMDAPIRSVAKSDMDLEYTIKEGDFYCTPKGWTMV